MSWAFLDDHADENPKLLAVGAEAAWYWACGLCFCRRNEAVPGFIPRGKAFTLCDVRNPRRVVQLLVEANLWEQVEGGYEIHDYGKVYRNGKPVSAETSAKRAEAGRLGGLAKASKPPGKTIGKVAKKSASDSSSKKEANTHARPAREDPTPTPRISEENTTTDLSGLPAREVGNGGGGNGKNIRCPKDLRLTSDQRATLESGLIPGWAIDVLTVELVATWQADPTDVRPLAAWLKCLSKAVSGEWNRRGSELVRPDGTAPVPADSINSAEGFW